VLLPEGKRQGEEMLFADGRLVYSEKELFPSKRSRQVGARALATLEKETRASPGNGRFKIK